ncbi:glycosyltransferase family 2 protein [Halodesulfovibrio sp. MK-HDV]|uniref:glycosyltransferase family 2 protein n=1 Tax=Halodesulfovibrio sp. MK-HDV TaxID=2599925 RepID=UPI0013F92237|nr:glycosyltransferase family 2 protein [Halodesulfovibrio sp. MK-HDV]KAF1075617.1 Polyprenol monophosphomannose synthase [Halodesulfovibrio sp. MK-HDV]
MSINTMNDNKIAIIIPAHNEATTITNVICTVKKHTNAIVIVVNDASTDETRILAEHAGATVIDLPVQLGAWGAMQAGMRYAQQEEIDIVVTFDADNQHPAESICSLVNCINDNCDVAIGSCVGRGTALRHFAWTLFRKLSGLEIKDLTSGFRAYNRKSYAILTSSKASLIDYQDLGILLLLHNAGMKMSEISVTINERLNDKSRIFNSWNKVAEYMVLTTILVLCHKRITLPKIPTQ